jgi:uncharacterized sulfatase
MRGSNAVAQSRDSLRESLSDKSYSVRVIAAEALGRYGNADDVRLALPVLADAADIGKHGVFVSMLALNAVDAMDDKAAPIRQAVQQLPKAAPAVPGRMKNYVPGLIKKTLADFNAPRGAEE